MIEYQGIEGKVERVKEKEKEKENPRSSLNH